MLEALEIDATGLKCPMPVIKLQQQVRKSDPGQVIHILTTDGAAEKDIRSWCRLNHHYFLSIESQKIGQLISIKVKGASTPPPHSHKKT